MVLVVDSLPANAGDIKDMGLIPGWGISAGEGHGSPRESHGQRSLADYTQSVGSYRVGLN